MKRSLIFVLILSLALTVIAVGCSPAAKKPSPSPKEEPSASLSPSPLPSPSPTVPPRELVFDADGNVIEDENGHVDISAAVAGSSNFTLDEVIKLIPYSDGALATAVCYELGRRLLKDFDNVISKLAAAELPEDRVTVETAALGIGFELQFDLEGGIVTEKDCEILYSEHDDLTERERYVLNKIVEGFEKD